MSERRAVRSVADSRGPGDAVRATCGAGAVLRARAWAQRAQRGRGARPIETARRKVSVETPVGCTATQAALGDCDL